MPVHSNGYVTTAAYGQSYAQYGANYTYGHTYTGWGDTWRDDNGWPNYTNSGASGYSQTYVNYSENRRYDNPGSYTVNTPYDTVDMSPVISGEISPSGGSTAATSITIDLSGITYEDPESTPRVSSKIYYAFSSDGGTIFEDPVEIGTTETDTYVWNLLPMRAGKYKLYITMYDGNSWSAVWDSVNHVWAADYVETGARGTVVETTQYNTTYYSESEVFTVIKYVPPEWVSSGVKAENVAQLKTEINNARDSFGLSAFIFADISIVNNFTKVEADQVEELQTAANPIYEAGTGHSYDFNRIITREDENVTKVENQDYNDIQDLLESLS